MKFCTKCDNMYYIQINDENTNQLEYYCRFCKNVDTLVTTEGLCIIRDEFKQDNSKGSQAINEYTKMDPTLPRLYNLKCPNTDCKTNTDDKKAEIIYIRINDNELKYLYLCNTCNFTWKTNENKI